MTIKKDDHPEFPYVVTFRYDPDTIAMLKESVHWKDRMWDIENKCWRMTERGVAIFGRKVDADWLCALPYATPTVSVDFEPDKYFLAPFKTKLAQREFIKVDRPDAFGTFADVGTGKSAMACLEFFKRKAQGKVNRMMVVVCMAGLRWNWYDDVEKLFGVEIDIIDGEMGERFTKVEKAESSIAVTIFTSLQNDELMDTMIAKYDMFAVDEIHLRVKDKKCRWEMTGEINPETGKEIRKKKGASVFGGLSQIAKRVRHRLALTGTPVPNKPTNAFTSLHFLDPAAFPSKFTFDKNYEIRAGKFNKVIGYKNLATLKGYLQHYGFFALKKDYVDIPPKTEKTVWVDCSPKTSKILRSMMKVVEQLGNLSTLELDELYMNIHTAIACPNDRYGFKGDKVSTVKEILSSIPAGEKAIVFTSLKGCNRELEEAIGKDKCRVIDGDRTDKSNREAEATFKTSKDINVLIATVQTLGAGYNFQCAKHIIMYDTVMNGAQFEQALGRAYREGQLQEVQVWMITMRIPFDMNRRAMIQEQRDMAERLMDEGLTIQPQQMRRLLSQVM
jgi:superfamily II DNA or RNA helicase